MISLFWSYLYETTLPCEIYLNLEGFTFFRRAFLTFGTIRKCQWDTKIARDTFEDISPHIRDVIGRLFRNVWQSIGKDSSRSSEKFAYSHAPIYPRISTSVPRTHAKLSLVYYRIVASLSSPSTSAVSYFLLWFTPPETRVAYFFFFSPDT